MPIYISFSDTTAQFLDGSKTVTRRGHIKGGAWLFAKPGAEYMACEKLPRSFKGGEPPSNQLGLIRVVSVRREPLSAITQADCVLEGFPDWAPADFIEFYTRERKCSPDFVVTRIEFERIETPSE